MRKAKEKQKPADRAREDINSDAAEAMTIIRAEQEAANQYNDEQDDEYDDESYSSEEEEELIVEAEVESAKPVNCPTRTAFFQAAPKEDSSDLGSIFRGLPF